MLRYTLQRREKSALRNLLVSSSSEIFSLFLPGSGLSWGRGWIQHWKNLMLLIWVRASFESDIKKSLLDSYSQQLVRLSQPFFWQFKYQFQKPEPLSCLFSKFVWPVQGWTWGVAQPWLKSPFSSFKHQQFIQGTLLSPFVTPANLWALKTFTT